MRALYASLYFPSEMSPRAAFIVGYSFTLRTIQKICSATESLSFHSRAHIADSVFCVFVLILTIGPTAGAEELAVFCANDTSYEAIPSRERTIFIGDVCVRAQFPFSSVDHVGLFTGIL